MPVDDDARARGYPPGHMAEGWGCRNEVGSPRSQAAALPSLGVTGGGPAGRLYCSAYGVVGAPCDTTPCGPEVPREVPCAPPAMR